MKWVFIHPPRTGGTSIRNQIGWGAGPNEKHAHYKRLAERIDFSDVWTFATIRNPYDRAVSLWSMWGNVGHRGKSFVEWMADLAASWPEVIVDPPRDAYRWIADGIGYTHLAPQVFWLDGGEFDCLVRFEKRVEYLELVSRHIGIEIDPNVKLRAIPASKRSKSIRRYHTEETRAIVRELYAEDFRRLGYRC